MEPTPKFSPAKDQIQSIEWTETNEETGRYLGKTPLITDGNLLYLISVRNQSKSEKEAQKDEEEPSDFKPRLVCEVYDPAQNFKFLREVTLYKDE